MEHFVFGFILFLAIGVVIWNSSRSKAKQTDVNEEVVKKETEEVLEKIRAEREIKPAPVASLEPVVTPEPVVEKTVTVESKAEAIEAVVEKKNKRIAKATIKKPAAKKTKAKVNG
jgi:hypothetical protein